ncbi:putative sulfate exporter family transporter [Rhodobacteraceae bacterium XHP0102]|nr:putative sulfate exporter family transporter [Rhodobacteraceae bacterium XHP0102]
MALLVAMAAQFLSDHYGAPVMLMAILLGIPFHFLSQDPRMAEGIHFAGRTVLRVGVALLGLRITAQLLDGIGVAEAVMLAMAVGTTICAGIWLAPRFGKSGYFGFLAGGSVAICGASAALAISALLPKRHMAQDDVTFTVVAVTVLSSIAMILYPMIATSLGLSTHAAGIFLGGTIHDVAQVVGAGYSISDETGDLSTLVKLFRVMMLAPVILVATLILRKAHLEAGEGGKAPPLIPAFVAGFIALAVLGTLDLVPATITDGVNLVSRACLVVAVAAVGMKTSLQAFATVGRNALALLIALTLLIACLVGLGLVILS